SVAGGEKLTQTGMAVGTPAYMSPEQAAGDENLDGRSDLYSLGCVLYEMLVGQVPFTGPTPQSIMARHTMDTAPPPKIMRDTIPDDLEDVIYCALAKSPADRFRTAAEFAEALEAVITGESPRLTKTGIARRPRRRAKSHRPLIFAAGAVLLVGGAFAGWQLLPRGQAAGAGAGGLDFNHIAVLYFDDLSPDRSLAYVADGLTEELIRRLEGVAGLEVVSRNGSAQFRDTDASRDSIARALEAGTLIEGSVMPAGDRLQVSTYLVDGVSGADFDRANFTVDADDYLVMQDSLADEITVLLREHLGEEITLRERRAAAANAAAWALVQQGERLRKEAEALLSEDDTEGAFQAFERADSILERAEAADPDWIEPIVLRAQIAYRESRNAPDLQAMAEWIEVGMGHAQRALGREENHAKALELRGTLQYFHWLLGITPDPDEAESQLNAARADLEAAVAEDPSLASAYSTLSHLYYQFDEVASVVRAAQRAYQADAYLGVAAEVVWRLFFGSFDLEQLTEARRWCAEGHRRFPKDHRFAECRLWEMTMSTIEPNVDEAWRLYEEVGALAPEPRREMQQRRAQMLVGGILARAELPDSARNVLLAARASFELDPTQDLVQIEAYMRVLLGDYDEAVDLLEQYAATSEDPLEAIDPDYWLWRDLQDHPGFRKLVGR
ncbi:MAG: hypothetical protein ACE5JM_12405, partial [Armatimonadota bacterium]